jgi:hypothetical protein
MEFFSLAAHMSKPEMREKAQRVFDVLDREGGPVDVNGGRLWPIHIRPETGKTVGSTVRTLEQPSTGVPPPLPSTIPSTPQFPTSTLPQF